MFLSNIGRQKGKEPAWDLSPRGVKTLPCHCPPLWILIKSDCTNKSSLSEWTYVYWGPRAVWVRKLTIQYPSDFMSYEHNQFSYYYSVLQDFVSVMFPDCTKSITGIMNMLRSAWHRLISKDDTYTGDLYPHFNYVLFSIWRKLFPQVLAEIFHYIFSVHVCLFYLSDILK